MLTHQNLRAALVAHLGQPLTPEVAAAIEVMAHGRQDESIDPAQFAPQAYKTYTFQLERFRDIVAELHTLHEQHWQETERHRHGIGLNPDYPALLIDEQAGRMLQFTVRDAARTLVGNLRLYLAHSRHTRTLHATEDTLYIVPEHRGGFMAVAFLRYAEQCLRDLGVAEMRADSKLVNNADVLMRRMGYQPVAMQFVKILKESPDVQ